MQVVIQSRPDRPDFETRTDYTITEVGEMLNLDPSTVRTLIHSGSLAAWVVNPGAKRPTYRISREAIETLRNRQSVAPPIKSQPVRRKREGVIEFY